MYEYFSKLLQENELTVAEVSKATGISQSQLSMWKLRDNLLASDKLQVLAEYFRVPMEYFLTGNKNDAEDYYINKDAKEAAEFLFDNPEYKVLFDASRKVKKEDIEKVAQMIELMSK